jgi:hypothetical protein
MLDMLAGSAFGLLQQEFAFRAQLAQTPSIRSPVGSVVGLRTVGSHRTGTCLGQIFHRSRGQDSRFSSQVQLLCCRLGGWGGMASNSARRLSLRPPLPLSIPLRGGADVSITRAAPVVRISWWSSDQTLAGSIDEVVPWCPRRSWAASNGPSWGEFVDRGPKFWRG